jgi:hypothetical protein
MADRQGIEIDYCPACRGVWLDRGELDKIVERSAQYTKREGSDPDEQRPYPPQGGQQGGYSGDHGHGGSYHDPKYGGHSNDPYYNKHKKKKGFLGDFFDFD